MKHYVISKYVLLLCLILLTPIALYAQFGNTISGFVFGFQRQPVVDVVVEILDDYSRTLGRTKTNASGRYSFSRIPPGRFRIRVMTSGTDYQEQEQDVELQNFTISNGTRGSISSGFENVQKDFYLALRKGSNQANNRPESIFVQEIPQNAKAKYEKAIDLLNDGKKDLGVKELKSAIEAFPDYYSAIERLGTEYIQLGHFVPAQILFQRAIEINSRGYKSWYGYAYALYSQNKNDAAINAVEKAISLNQFSVESPLLAGVILRRIGKYDQSEKQLVKAKDLSKGSTPEVHRQLAILYGNNLNRYNDAIAELKLFLKASPTSKDSENIKKLIKQFEEKSKERINK